MDSKCVNRELELEASTETSRNGFPVKGKNERFTAASFRCRQRLLLQPESCHKKKIITCRASAGVRSLYSTRTHLCVSVFFGRFQVSFRCG